MRTPPPDDAMARTDAELVAAHLGGDRSALGAMYDRFADPLYDTAAAMLRDRHEAADVVQDVFVVAAQRLDQLRDPSRLRPWLFAVLRNEVYRRSGRRRRTVTTDLGGGEGAVEMAAPVDPFADGESVVLAELADLVRDAAGGLDARDQLVLELSVRQGLEGADLADALGVSPDQSYVLVHRMRERVERSLGALTVARAGRRDCPELAKVLTGWDGTFDVLVRKRVARHVERCEVCEETKRRHAVVPLVRGAPAMAAPPELRDRVLRLATTAPVPAHRFDRAGFPRPPRERRRAWPVEAAVLVSVLVAGIAIVAGGDDAAAPGDDAVDAAAVPTTVGVAESAPTSAPASSLVATTSTSVPPSTDLPTTTVTSTTLVTSTTVAAAPPVEPTTTVPRTRPGTTVPAAATTAPDTTVPPTTAPAPTTTAAPPTTPAPPPGRLDLGATTVDLGAGAARGTVTLTNGGGQTLSWNLVPVGDVSPFAAAPTTGQLAPGASVQVQVSMNRAGRPEGDYARAFSATSSATGGGQIQVRGRVEVSPRVEIIGGPSVCTGSTSTVAARVADESAISGVELRWTGSAPGSTPMTLGTGGIWSATMAPQPPGVTYTVVARDVRGNVGSSPTISC